MKKFLKKRKKLLISIAVILIAVIAVSFVNASNNKKAAAEAGKLTADEVSVIEQKDLVSSISATGVVESVESKMITSTLNGVKIDQIMVEVGDYVSIDEIIGTFQSENIETNLADAKANLYATNKRSNIDVSSAERNLQEAEDSRDISAERNSVDVADAWVSYQAALVAYNPYAVAYTKAKANTAASKTLMDASLARLNGYNAAATTAENSYDTTLSALPGLLVGTYDFSDLSGVTSVALSGKTSANYTVSGGDASIIDSNLNTLRTHQTEYNSNTASAVSENTAYTGYQTTYASMQVAESTAKAPYDSTLATANAKLSAYTQLARAQADSTRNNESTISARESSLESSNINANIAGLSYEQQVAQYEEQLEGCTIKSPISGIVTAVNVEAGDTYSGGALITIEDNSAYVIATEIDEFNISKITLGQKVIIKTNATGDIEMAGKVISIAPRATQSATSSSVTYTVKISLDTANEDIRIDMTAKLSIILSSKENVLAVPFDAVQTDEDGKKFVNVYVEDASGTDTKNNSEPIDRTKGNKIYVTTGIENDYYIEIISDELTVGMQVLMPVTENTDSISDRLMNQGPMGGF